MTLGIAWGRGAILPARGKLDIATLDQGYVLLITDEPQTALIGDIRWAIDGPQPN